MKISKIITLGVLVGLGWQNQTLIVKRAQLALNAVPVVQTYIDLEQYAGALNKYIRNEGRAPDDLAAFLRENFTKAGGADVSLDAFSTPYELRYDDSEGPVYWLVSCGPDRTCDSDDDLTAIVYDKRS